MFKQRIEASGITIEGASGLKQAPPAVSELAAIHRPLLDGQCHQQKVITSVPSTSLR